MRILCLAILPLLTLSAQQFPDGAALLERSANALKTYSTFQYTEVMSGGPAGMESSMLKQGTSSGKSRMAQKIGDMDGVLIVSDGRNTWMYMGMMKRYMKMPMDSSVMEELAGELSGAPAGQAGGNAKVIRSETLDIDGEPHDCWVVESRIGEISNPGATVKGGIETHWIDKISSIEFKSVIASSIQVAGTKEPLESIMTVSRHGYKFNLPLDDALFVFTPPAGATETDELFPGMKAAFSKSEAEPGHSETAPVPMAQEPQAFVPNLTPVERVEAVRPKGMAEGVRPEVELLVTVDPAGGVVKAEALSGAEALRKSAIDAVMQWKFHSVIRNGAPVFAYTHTTVDFTDFSRPVKPAVPDMGDAMESLKRVQALEERFPRTPEQELADLEQDLGSGAGVDRSFAVPQLAKAALKAGALDKAATYAHDLLRSPSSDPMYGQALYDGNMVLGMVALHQGDVPEARRYLLESAKTKGSPVLDSFGPNMQLAKALLEKGERDAVLEYFESCRSFWSMGAQQLDAWTATVRRGGVPAFGANLVY
jgi:outer membrane lipoprotein-sorting protein